MAPGVGVCMWDHARQIVRLPHFFAGEGRPGKMWRVSPSEGRGQCRAHVGGLATAPEGGAPPPAQGSSERYCKRTLGRRLGRER